MRLKIRNRNTRKFSASAFIATMDTLPEDCRMTIWLRFGMRFSHQEICDTLDIPQDEQVRLVYAGLARISKAMGLALSPHELERELEIYGIPKEVAPENIVPHVCQHRRHVSSSVHGREQRRILLERKFDLRYNEIN